MQAHDRAQLQEAFRVFTDAAERLEATYGCLRAHAEELSRQLARTDAELTRELQHKQALVERQRALLEALPAGVVVVDADDCVREANEAATRLLGASPVGRTWREVAATLMAAGAVHEWIVPGGAGRRIDLQEKMVDASGERIVVLYDITEAHAARVDQARNERLTSMGEMAARLAHQLRTPLSTAMLYAAQLERADLTLADRTHLSDKILARLRALERVTRDMLRFVRGEQASGQQVDLGTLLGEAAHVVQPLMASRGIGFACEDHTAGISLHGDRHGLTAALLSLLENAAQATPQGGKVRICAIANSVHVRVQVVDSGGGIPAHALPRVFEPFFSTRPEGTGLGLAIVKSVIEAHGGVIEVASSPEAGTSFTLTLPHAKRGPQAMRLPRTAESLPDRAATLEFVQEAA
jgi:two-component system sensor histidine kinase FlrB